MLILPNGFRVTETPARNFYRWKSNEGQSSFEFSIPSSLGTQSPENFNEICENLCWKDIVASPLSFSVYVVSSARSSVEPTVQVFLQVNYFVYVSHKSVWFLLFCPFRPNNLIC